MLRAVIIDDEQGSANVLNELLLKYCPTVERLGIANSVPEGVLLINKVKPDIVFLDVEMPEYTGFELLNFFREVDFEIIFVTAYSQYAVRAFEVSAVGYLLKPVDHTSLQDVVARVEVRRQHHASQQRLELLRDALRTDDVRKIAFPMADGLLFTEVDEIIFIEADGAYANVYLKNGSRILVSKKLKFFEDLLANRRTFFRAHRSYLINVNFIRKYLKGEGTLVMDNDSNVALARERKQEFEGLLQELGLSL
jgi:two-component system LytT family response regulator